METVPSSPLAACSGTLGALGQAYVRLLWCWPSKAVSTWSVLPTPRGAGSPTSSLLSVGVGCSSKPHCCQAGECTSFRPHLCISSQQLPSKSTSQTTVSSRTAHAAPRGCRRWSVPTLDAPTAVTSPAEGHASQHTRSPLRRGCSVCPHRQDHGTRRAQRLARWPGCRGKEGARGAGRGLPACPTHNSGSYWQGGSALLAAGAFPPAPQRRNKSLRAEMLPPLLALPAPLSHVFLACEQSWRRFCGKVGLQLCSFLL